MPMAACDCEWGWGCGVWVWRGPETRPNDRAARGARQHATAPQRSGVRSHITCKKVYLLAKPHKTHPIDVTLTLSDA